MSGWLGHGDVVIAFESRLLPILRRHRRRSDDAGEVELKHLSQTAESEVPAHRDTQVNQLHVTEVLAKSKKELIGDRKVVVAKEVRVFQGELFAFVKFIT